ncbi:MAG: hypothetical protein CFH10_01511, partial [Alphaproteobacteria bacterium MarineAlpha4_Bin2]
MLSNSAVRKNGAGIIYGGYTTTYRELETLSRRAAAGLAAQGIGRGDRI